MDSVITRILAGIPIVSVSSFIVVLGLSIIGLTFTGFLLRQGVAAANGRVGDADSDEPSRSSKSED